MKNISGEYNWLNTTSLKENINLEQNVTRYYKQG